MANQTNNNTVYAHNNTGDTAMSTSTIFELVKTVSEKLKNTPAANTGNILKDIDISQRLALTKGHCLMCSFIEDRYNEMMAASERKDYFIGRHKNSKRRDIAHWNWALDCLEIAGVDTSNDRKTLEKLAKRGRVDLSEIIEKYTGKPTDLEFMKTAITAIKTYALSEDLELQYSLNVTVDILKNEIENPSTDGYYVPHDDVNMLYDELEKHEAELREVDERISNKCKELGL